MAVTQAKDKYYLRSLHQEIGLFDRKLAHMLKYDTFASDKERDAATGKLNSKRELLVRNARQLVSEGVEYKVSDLPRSIRTEEQLAAEASVDDSKPDAATPSTSQERAAEPSIYDGSILNFRNEINEYIQKRRKSSSPGELAAI